MGKLEREYRQRMAGVSENVEGPANRWGQRALITNDPALLLGRPGQPPPGVMNSNMVDTDDLGVPRALNLQLRFALNQILQGTSQPILPFSPRYPIGVPISVETRRSVDARASLITETSIIQTTSDVLPFDIITARKLGVTVRVGAVPGTTVWVEAVATPVEDIATQNKILGWPVVNSQVFSGASNAVQQVFLIPNADRVQFVIVNTSTDGNLILSFGPALASWAGPVGTIVLPKNMFASYESPVGGFRGQVSGIWDGAAPTGGALVTEGTFF
jgi:hypothetical protein